MSSTEGLQQHVLQPKDCLMVICSTNVMASEQDLVAAEVADMTEVLITLLFAGTVKYSNVFDISDNKAQWFIRCHFPKKI